MWGGSCQIVGFGGSGSAGLVFFQTRNSSLGFRALGSADAKAGSAVKLLGLLASTPGEAESLLQEGLWVPVQFTTPPPENTGIKLIQP